MTDKYTLEEIKAAWHAGGFRSFRYLQKELTHPKHKFREGEVVMMYDSTRPDGRPYQITKLTTDIGRRESRPLRLSEMPRAVEDLRKAVKTVIFEESIYEDVGINRTAVLQTAIAKFDAEIER